ncbi:MAG: hypothetical protein RLY31_904 [Bacteroidota bacterium]
MLGGLFTTYAYRRNRLMRRFAGRLDKEDIPVDKIRTAVPLAVLMRLRPEPHRWNEWFDRWVAGQLSRYAGQKVFIGWSGMSLHSLRKARSLGMVRVLERGSAHIVHQDVLLREEYGKFGIDFRIDPRTIEKELQEYEEADYISIPSLFARRTFVAEGIPEHKLLLNNYGTSDIFQPGPAAPSGSVFRIVYLGNLTVQKGLVYLFQALRGLEIPPDKWEAWFIGKVDAEMRSTVEQYRQPNWKFFGHVNHYELPGLLARCDVGVMPSIQDGFGMVIPQMMGCGVPVIASTNSAGEDVIRDGVNGFLVPIRQPDVIRGRLERLYGHPEELQRMKEDAAKDIRRKSLAWSDYGDRYADHIRRLTGSGTAVGQTGMAVHSGK